MKKVHHNLWGDTGGPSLGKKDDFVHEVILEESGVNRKRRRGWCAEKSRAESNDGIESFIGNRAQGSSSVGGSGWGYLGPISAFP